MTYVKNLIAISCSFLVLASFYISIAGAVYCVAKAFGAHPSNAGEY